MLKKILDPAKDALWGVKITSEKQHFVLVQLSVSQLLLLCEESFGKVCFPSRMLGHSPLC